MIILLILTQLLPLTFGNLITNYNLEVTPANIQLNQTVTITFSVATTITTTDYLLIIWPYSLSSSASFTGNYTYYTSCSSNTVTDSTLIATFYYFTTLNSLFYYFVEFYQAGTVTNLVSNRVYTLNFPSLGPSVSAGFQTGIKLMTTSSRQSLDGIIYDSNDAFGTFYLGGVPGSSILISMTIPTTTVNVNDPQASYTAYFDITPQTSISLHAKIVITLDNNAFSFLANSCQNLLVTGYQSLDIAKIIYSGNQVTIQTNSTLQQSLSFRVSCQVHNPVYPALSTISVATYYYNHPTIVEMASTSSTGTSVFSVSAFTWDKTLIKILAGWGVDLTEYGVSEAFRLYKDPDPAVSPNEKWYNGIKIYFIPPQDIPICNTITFSTINVTTGILKNSLYHTLPPCGSFQPSYTITSSQEIVFTNVGPLESSEDYFVAFKINLPFTTSALVALGAIKITSLSGYLLIDRLSDNDLLVNDPLIKNTITTNRALKAAYTPTGSQAYHENYDSLIPTSIGRTLYITHDSDNTILDSNNANNQGFEYYTTYNLQVEANPSCTITNASVATDDLIRFCYANTVDSAYTYIQVAMTVGAPSTLFNTTKANFLFKITGTTASRASEFAYMSDQVYDFYARSVNNLVAPTQIGLTNYNTQVWFFNSYCISQVGYLDNVDVTMVNWMFATLASGNTGDDYPSMIRVSGKFSSSDMFQSNKLAIFFNGFEPFYNNNTQSINVYCGGYPQDPSCIRTINSDVDPSFDYSDIYTLKRIILQIPFENSTSTSFNFYIPGVPQTTSSGTSSVGVRITFYIATVSEVSTYLSSYNMYRTVDIKKYPILLLSNKQSYLTAITDMANFTDYPGQFVGEYQSLTLTDYSGYDLGNSTASGVTICNKYNFYSIIYENLLSSDTKDLCTGFDYYSQNAIHRYCMACPRQGGSLTPYTFENLKYPFLHGVDFDDWTIAYSQNDQVINYTKVTALNTLNASKTPQIISFNTYPLTFIVNGIDNKLMVRVNLQIELPPTFYINISFSTGTNWARVAPNCLFTTSEPTAPSANCTVTGFQIKVQATTSVEMWPTGLYYLVFYVDIGSSLSVTTEMFGLVFQAVNVNGAIVDQQTTGTSALSLSYANSGSQPVPTMNAWFGGSLLYSYGARGDLFLWFTITERFISVFDEIAISSPEFLAVNAIGDFSCRVLEFTGAVSTRFARCLISATTGETFIRIFPKAEIVDPLTYIVELVSVMTPSSQPANNYLNVSLTRSADLYSSQSALIYYTFNALDGPLSSLSLTKVEQVPGRITQYNLNFIPLKGAMSSTSIVYITFPPGYPHNFGTKNVYCKIGTFIVLCTVINNRILRVTGYAGYIAIGSQVTINIYGIRNPLITSARTITVSFSAFSYGIYESTTFTDSTTPSIPSSPLIIESFTLSSPILAQRSTISITLTLGSAITAIPMYLSIDFADLWGYYSQSSAPTYSLSTSSAPLTGTATLLGSRVLVPIGSTFPVGSQISLSLFNAWTGSQIPCVSVRPATMSILGSDGITLAQGSIYNTDVQTTYQQGSRKLIVTYKDEATEFGTITLYRGLYSRIITIKPETGRFATDVTFTLSDQYISVVPSTLTAAVGTSELQFRIGYSLYSGAWSIYLSFIKTESSSIEYYNQPNPIAIDLRYSTFPQSFPVLYIEQGGTAAPIVIDFTNNPPMEQTTLTLTPVDSVISVSSPTVVLSITNPRAYFTVTASKSAAVGTAYYVSLSIGPSYVYTLASNLLQVQVTVSTSVKVSIIDMQLINEAKYVRNQTVVANFTQQSAAYWGIYASSRFSTPYTTCTELKRQALLFVSYSSYIATDPMQMQFIISGAYSLDDVQTFYNLRTNEQYTISVCAEGQNGQMSSIQTKTFTTPFNQAQMHSFTLVTNSLLKTSEIARIICYLKYIFQVKGNNIFTLNFGETNCSLAGSTSTTLATSRTYVFYFRGDPYSEQKDNSRWLLQSYVYHLNNPASSESKAFSTFLASVKSGLNYTRTFSSSNIQFDSPSLGTSLVLTTGINFVTLGEIRLGSGPGYIYALAIPRVDAGTPTPYQVMNQTGPYGNKMFWNKVFYRGTGSISISVAGLVQGTRYNLFYIATNSDFTELEQSTKVLTLAFSTQTVSISSAGMMKFGMEMIICMVIMNIVL